MVEVAFYGDDFTGSTDAMVQYARTGLRAVLLVTLPSAPELRTLAERYDVIGVAGIARSLPPDEQATELRPVLQALRELEPRFIQYKVCSTADSAPTRGSIGRALEVGRDVCGPSVVPVLVAQPELGRYTVFSHHFAAEDGTIHRLDRQPTMSTHPSTPMHESDLRRHLAAQTTLPITSLHLTTYADLPASYAAAAQAGAVVLDAVTDEDLTALGSAILETAKTKPAFAIGSGGLSRALALALRPNGAPVTPPKSSAGGPVLVVSGSQSRRTADQLEHARAAGWTVLPLTDEAPREAAEAFAAGVDGVVVHTNALTAEDLPRIPTALAGVIRTVATTTAVRRVVVAGGDTSGQVLGHLGITALELVHSVSPGVHLCRASSEFGSLDVLLKPGQLGPVDLFTEFRRK
ncbi:four-carbon acid sugar kinase family protein [Kribbella shirazensis]|uniref:Uncharacterized protein YgbK (DUF1537 family) n=1 Tax=Kribbella shirazensis TaxID=1105143 RepID=A0A7X5VBF2_9ACTN|nr:uncharacterized protein YgbK (DUF1537 family) [Kribbella shirazensis]